MLHLRGCEDEPLHHSFKVSIAVVEAEDQPSGSDPAQRQAMHSQVVLQHPVEPAWLGVEEGPDTGHICRLQGDVVGLHRTVEVLNASIPAFIQTFIDGLDFWCFNLIQEG